MTEQNGGPQTGAREARQKAQLGKIGDRPYWVLLFSVLVRALHQVGAAVFLAVVLVLDKPAPGTYVQLAYWTGALLAVTEWLRHRQMYRELSGVGTVLKLLLIGAGLHGLLPLKFAVMAAFLVASVCSHLPKNLRHRLLY